MRLSTLILAIVTTSSLHAQSSMQYNVTKSFVLGGSGRWDYIIPDSKNHRLFIAREKRLMVVDEVSGKLIGEVSGINGAHGAAIVNKSGHGFATAGEDKAVVMFDLKTFKVQGETPAAEDADAILYDAVSNRVFTLNGDANSSTVIDGDTGKLITNIPLLGKPENGVSAGDGKVFANITDKSEIVEIDAKKAVITKRWSTAPCEHPVPMAIDKKDHRIFSGCRSGVMVVSDYAAGKVITTVPIGTGVDGAGYDPVTHNVFASNADGTFTVIHQESADEYEVTQTLKTPIGSRNMGLDPATRKIYVASAEFGPASASNHNKPSVLDGTFTLLQIEAVPPGH